MPFSGKSELLVDLAGRIVFANTYFCDLVGIGHDKITDMLWFDFVPPEHTDEAKKLLELNENSSAKPVLVQLRCINGKPIWVKIQCSALRHASGRAIRDFCESNRREHSNSTVVSNVKPD